MSDVKEILKKACDLLQEEIDSKKKIVELEQEISDLKANQKGGNEYLNSISSFDPYKWVFTSEGMEAVFKGKFPSKYIDGYFCFERDGNILIVSIWKDGKQMATLKYDWLQDGETLVFSGCQIKMGFDINE